MIALFAMQGLMGGHRPSRHGGWYGLRAWPRNRAGPGTGRGGEDEREECGMRGFAYGRSWMWVHQGDAS